ncbi:MAG: stage V sporulation protein AD [Clostridiales bacterium]|nr:stage V sporulation protein AD [Clostridiales bacterium]
MEQKRISQWIGKQSILFEEARRPYVLSSAAVGGKKEGEGPLGVYLDEVVEDPFCGGKTWEEAESRLQEKAVRLAIHKSKLKKEQIRYLFGGDLLGQLIATSFGISIFQIPLFGIYGACSTMGEALLLGAMTVAGGYGDYVISMTSSHTASAEKQFRFPMEYGNQRPLCASWTVTGSGAVVLSYKKPEKEEPLIRINGGTPGKIVDFGLKDSMNMGACMAPAAADTIYRNLRDLDVPADYYDQIITGDLGQVGRKILLELLSEKGYEIRDRHMDCGIAVYDSLTQDTHSGGSGCGCSAITLNGYIMHKMKKGDWKRILFVPTGALLSPISFNEGNSVPGIAHGVILEAETSLS